MNEKIALIEAGGTKFIVGVGDASRQIHARTRIDTARPEETIPAAIDWLRQQGGNYAAVGIASFGPLDLDPASPTWGHITRTTKPHWSDADIAGPFAGAFGCPVAIDTDVNGAALAEWMWGAGHGTGSTLYLTIGTGVGGGAVVGGRLIYGVSHPEMGHIRIPRHPADTGFAGHCPFHGDCLEGLVAGPSIKARWGASLSELPVDHIGHEIVAWYLAQAAATFQAILEPARVILGGGVMGTPGLIERIRAEASAASNGYFAGVPQEIIVPPALGENTGLLGALALAKRGCRQLSLLDR
ncbi:MAG: ROK family protein [Sphingopyxis sp.]|uniref:ROK family protein n=1 Tax=Sphingopyxis sp. TaxID=1908224 RepID=UPI001A60CC86|nr:ROK family protein [Sphingopyxis sp.]MBL9070023.1 ROK family protein [Sphingopyxis sp.]